MRQIVCNVPFATGSHGKHICVLKRRMSVAVTVLPGIISAISIGGVELTKSYVLARELACFIRFAGSCRSVSLWGVIWCFVVGIVYAFA